MSSLSSQDSVLFLVQQADLKHKRVGLRTSLSEVKDANGNPLTPTDINNLVGLALDYIERANLTRESTFKKPNEDFFCCSKPDYDALWEYLMSCREAASKIKDIVKKESQSEENT